MVGPVAFQRIEPLPGNDSFAGLRPRDADGAVAESQGRGPRGGDRRGADEWDNEADTRRAVQNQHSFAGEDFEIDAAHNYHGATELA